MRTGNSMRRTYSKYKQVWITHSAKFKQIILFFNVNNGSNQVQVAKNR